MNRGRFYYHGAVWQVVRSNPGPRARVFVWVRQGGPPPRGASVRLWRVWEVRP